MKGDMDIMLNKREAEFEKSRQRAVKVLIELKGNPDIDLFGEAEAAVITMAGELAVLEFLKDNFYLGGARMKKGIEVLEFSQLSEEIPKEILEGRISGFILKSSKNGGETPCLTEDEITHLLSSNGKEIYAFKLPVPERIGELFENKITQLNSKSED